MKPSKPFNTTSWIVFENFWEKECRFWGMVPVVQAPEWGIQHWGQADWQYGFRQLGLKWCGLPTVLLQLCSGVWWGVCLLTKAEMITCFQRVGISHDALVHPSRPLQWSNRPVWKKGSKSQFMVCHAVSGKLLQKSTFHLFAACWWCQEMNFFSQVNFSDSDHKSRKIKCWW